VKTPRQRLVTKLAKIEIGKTNPKHRGVGLSLKLQLLKKPLAERGQKIMA